MRKTLSLKTDFIFIVTVQSKETWKHNLHLKQHDIGLTFLTGNIMVSVTGHYFTQMAHDRVNRLYNRDLRLCVCVCVFWGVCQDVTASVQIKDTRKQQGLKRDAFYFEKHTKNLHFPPFEDKITLNITLCHQCKSQHLQPHRWWSNYEPLWGLSRLVKMFLLSAERVNG